VREHVEGSPYRMRVVETLRNPPEQPPRRVRSDLVEEAGRAVAPM
jgi:hypothetical protein